MGAKLENVPTSKGHTVMIWNSQSLLNKRGEVDWICIEADPEIFRIVETWCHNHKTSICRNGLKNLTSDAAHIKNVGIG